MLIHARALNVLIFLRWYTFWVETLKKNLYSFQKGVAQEIWKLVQTLRLFKPFFSESPVTTCENPTPFFRFWRDQF